MTYQTRYTGFALWLTVIGLLGLMALVLLAGVAQADETGVRYTNAGSIVRVSLTSTGQQINGRSEYPIISDDGRYVVFSSWGTDIVPGETFGSRQVYVYDTLTKQTERVSVSSSNEPANQHSDPVDISADGRFVGFSSAASNLVTGDTNGLSDAFIHDRQTKTTIRVSLTEAGEQRIYASGGPYISDDRRFAMYCSAIVQTPAYQGVYLYDLETKVTSLVSVGPNGQRPNDTACTSGAMTGDGRYLVYTAKASNLVAGDSNGLADVFVYDRQAGTTSRVSVSSTGQQANNYSFLPSISADGRYVIFGSHATNLVDNDTNDAPDLFFHDRQTGQTTRLSVSSTGEQSNGRVELGIGTSISNDGRFVAFASSASNLVDGDTNGYTDVFLRDTQTGQTTAVHLLEKTTLGSAYSGLSRISGNGRFVVFQSTGKTIVPDDTNGEDDIFLFDREGTEPPTPTPVAHDSGFRLDRDAWSFRNRAFVPELKHIVGAFGEAGVYTTDLFGNQTPIDTAEKMLSPSVGAGGACFGFAATSGLLVNGDALGLTPPISPFSNTFAIPDPGEHIVGGEPYFNESAVADFIIESFYHQFSIEFENEMVVSKNMSLANKLSAIKHAVRWDGFSSDPLLINLSRRSDNCNNHTVLPISFQEFPDGMVEVFIYDPNNPFGSNERQSIVFDLVNNSWNYQLNGFNARFGSDVTCTLLSGQQASGKIDIVHARTFSTNTTPAWWKVRLLNSPYRVWLEIFGSVATVTDETGNKLGDVNGTLVENIPDSFIFSPFGQFAANPVNWYVVKADKPLTATVSYANTPDDALTLFAAQATFDVGLKQGVTATDTLVIDSVANKVSLTGDGERVITTTRLFTNTEQIFTLHFNLDQAHSLSVQGLDNGSLKVVSGTPQQGATLTLEQNGGTGAENYQVTLPPLQPGDAQVITPNWTSDSVTVGTDVGNNGSIDTTVTVEGEQPPPPALHVYLPLIQKK